MGDTVSMSNELGYYKLENPDHVEIFNKFINFYKE
jgi:hypothetical protein